MDKKKMIEWIGTQNVGVSSKTMWVALMCPQCVNGNDCWNYDVPHTADDFSRCYHLSKFARLSLGDLRKVAKVFPYWKPIIDEWDNLVSAYADMCFDSVFSILQEKYDEIMNLKGFTKTSDSTWEREQGK